MKNSVKKQLWLEVIKKSESMRPTLTPIQIIAVALLSQCWIPDSITLQRIERILEFENCFEITSKILAECSPITPKIENLENIKYLEEESIIDVTTTSGQSVLTGIQRIVNSVVSMDIRMIKASVSNGKLTVIQSGQSRSKWEHKVNHFGAALWHAWLSTRITNVDNERVQSRLISLAEYFRQLITRQKKDPSDEIIYIPLKCTWYLLEVPTSRKQIDFLDFLNKAKLITLHVLLHDLIPLTHPHLCPPDPRGNFLRYLNMTSRAAEVVCISHDVERRYRSYLGAMDLPLTQPKIRSNPYPISPMRMMAGKPSRKVADFLAQNKPYLIATGGYTSRKNLGIVLGAIAIEEIPIDLVIVGNNLWGANYLEIEMKIWDQISSRVHSFPNVSDIDLYCLLERSIALVYPSLAEGFGLPILEGLSFGLPVLTSNLEPMNSISVAPIKIDPHKISDWSKSIKSLLNVGRVGPRQPKNRYSSGNSAPDKKIWSGWVLDFFGKRESE